MAKVKAPLFSFGARGALAETLVYFPWKGIECVRSYVVPANPNTAGQQTQRSYMTAGVTDWHGIGLDTDDVTAWNRRATTLPTSMSGFNAFIREHVNFQVGGDTPDMGFDGSIVDAGGGTFDVSVEEDGAAVGVDVIWGYSPTSLINTGALAEGVNVWTDAGIAAVAGATVFCRFQISDGGGIIGSTGIYRVTLA